MLSSRATKHIFKISRLVPQKNHALFLAHYCALVCILNRDVRVIGVSAL